MSSCCRVVTGVFWVKKKACHFWQAFFLYGALGRIRTFDRSVRSRVLYPAELRVRKGAQYMKVNVCSQAEKQFYLELLYLYQCQTESIRQPPDQGGTSLAISAS